MALDRVFDLKANKLENAVIAAYVHIREMPANSLLILVVMQ
jgi:hypothetical protein